jgi:hypothetical protein
MKVATGFLGLLAGTLISLMGLFLVLYRGEEGSEGNTWVNLGGKKVDADIVGIPLLAIGLAAVGVSLLALRRSRVP